MCKLYSLNSKLNKTELFREILDKRLQSEKITDVDSFDQKPSTKPKVYFAVHGESKKINK